MRNSNKRIKYSIKGPEIRGEVMNTSVLAAVQGSATKFLF
jgi:hypothetical protein